MVDGDIVIEEELGPYPSMVVGPEGDGGVVVLWRDLVVEIVLEKVKEMVVCMVKFWSCGGINGDGGGRI